MLTWDFAIQPVWVTDYAMPWRWETPSSSKARRCSAVGVVIAFFAVAFGFGMVWHIGWLALAGGLGIVATVLRFSWLEREEIVVAPEALARSAMARPAPGGAA